MTASAASSRRIRSRLLHLAVIGGLVMSPAVALGTEDPASLAERFGSLRQRGLERVQTKPLYPRMVELARVLRLPEMASRIGRKELAERFDLYLEATRQLTADQRDRARFEMSDKEWLRLRDGLVEVARYRLANVETEFAFEHIWRFRSDEEVDEAIRFFQSGPGEHYASDIAYDFLQLLIMGEADRFRREFMSSGRDALPAR